MKIYRKSFNIVLLTVFVIFCAFSVSADGGVNAHIAQTKPQNEENLLEGISSECAVAIETNTKTILAQQNGNEQRSISHLAKLMTLFLTAEQIQAGKLSLDDQVTVSAHANSMNGSQIWLNVGEKITVEELIKSITIGNANDACVALAEKVGTSEEAFVSMMNKRAAELGMKNTIFVDSTGIDKNTVSTANDLAILSAEILKFDNLTPYLTTWIDSVRGKAVGLVSTNRLIRTYSGVTGLKSSSSVESGECLIASATKGEMSICIVLLGTKTSDDKFSEAKKILDGSFAKYEIYTPEIDEKVYEEIPVIGGEELAVGVNISGLTNIVIEKGTYKSIKCNFTKAENINAPVCKDQVLGKIEFSIGDDIILEGKIVAVFDVKEMNMKFSLKKVLLNLLNI